MADLQQEKRKLEEAHALRDCWRMTPEDITVNVLPLFHIHGLSFATHLSLLTGGCLLELGAQDFGDGRGARWIEPGDVVMLKAEGLGDIAG